MRNAHIEIDGHEYGYSQVNHDTYGNPRIVIHYLTLGLDDYDTVKGFTKYRGRQFGGGYVFQSYNHEETIKWALSVVKDFQS